MNPKENAEIITDLESFLKELDDYRYYRVLQSNGKATKKQKEMAYTLREKLIGNVGRFRRLIKELTGEEKLPLSKGRESYTVDMWRRGLRLQFDLISSHVLGHCIDVMTEAIGMIKSDIEKGIRDKFTGESITPTGKKVMKVSPKAFIAHEGESRALTMLKEFLEALGAQYFIAEAKASDGRSIEGQVDWTQSKADFAICLATKGKAINKKTGKHYMAPNIADELGRARRVFGNKIILLVQKGVEVHTNIREIVYETFTTTNMEKAFIKIIKELKSWGFLTAGKIKE